MSDSGRVFEDFLNIYDPETAIHDMRIRDRIVIGLRICLIKDDIRLRFNPRVGLKLQALQVESRPF